jgi:alkylation response protein AidB-like acyl-CoA dehydrogenase
MPSYTAPVRDMKFVIHDVIGAAKYADLPGFDQASPDIVDAVLEAGATICEEVLQPLNVVGDREGCHYANGVVTTPAGFKAAYNTFTEAGWTALAADPEYGGQGMPAYLALAFNEMVSSSNMAMGMYPGLTHGAYRAIHAHANDELKRTYLPNMVSGKWSGTMNLTEPHCGTDLGLMRTKAEPQSDGTYHISGTKIFISAGEHDLVENIVHLVLAKIVGGPEGIKGVSLFIVPKFLVNADGSLGARNGVRCGSIEHKMGIHGNATCVMNYDSAVGYLVGEEHKGMRAMFTMMNEARLGVGLQGYSQSEVAFQNALTYAKDRIQGRALSGVKAPEKAADPIIVHPDVRRILMNLKAFNEGARALCLEAGLKADLANHHPTDTDRQAADDWMALMTPIIKGFLTDQGFAHAVNAQQVFGGHGYIQEWGMEQFVRDARIAMIYEGANGVQALDLVGRKLGMKGGQPLMAFMADVDRVIAEAPADLAPLAAKLATGKEHLTQATMWLMQNGMSNPDNAGAASSDYMHMFGLVALGYMWLRMMAAAKAKIDAGDSDPFYTTKLATGRYFIERMLPDTTSLLAKVQVGAEPLMALAADAF